MCGKFNSILRGVILFFAFCLLSGCYLQRQIKRNHIDYIESDWRKDSLLVQSFIKIDSVIKQNKNGRSFYCQDSVLKIITDKTKIPSTGGGSIVGAKFTLQDWVNWHNWFKNKFRKG